MQGSVAPDLSVLMNYEYEVDLTGDNALAYVLELAGSNKKTLEIGAGSGMITKHLVKTKGCDVVALEINPTSVEKLKSYVDRVYALDLNDPAWIKSLAGEGKFDTIIAADVLEHLYDPWTVLKGMKELLSETGTIILSLPHAAHCAIMSCLFEEDFQYGEWGLLDKTHIRFFGLHNIHTLHASAGLAITGARFVMRRPEETEFSERWAQLPKNVQAALSSNRHGHVYQVVTSAMPVEKVSAPVDLFQASAAYGSVSRPATFLQKVTAALRL
jgi:2-polyprenyl-3-methyl-5-hydroxy-6-metoxy-1,4-benzoquinol methylase